MITETPSVLVLLEIRLALYPGRSSKKKHNKKKTSGLGTRLEIRYAS